MFPHRFDFIVGERKAAGGRYWIRSQKFGEAPVYYIHFKGEPVKVAPQVLDGRLGAMPLCASMGLIGKSFRIARKMKFKTFPSG